MYKPSEEALLKGLSDRANIRDQYFQQLMSSSAAVLREIASTRNLDTPTGESTYSLACRIVEFEYPEIELPGAGNAGLFSTAGESTSYHVAEPIRRSDMARFADMIDKSTLQKQDELFVQGGFLHGPDWMLDGPAFVGYRGADGAVQTLDTEGVVTLSGLRPNATEQSSVVLVSVSQFFDGDYVKDFVTRLYATLTSGDEPDKRAYQAYEIISEMMSQSGITQEVVTGADQRVEKQFVSDSQSDEEALTEPVYGIQAAQADDVTQFIEKITGD